MAEEVEQKGKIHEYHQQAEMVEMVEVVVVASYSKSVGIWFLIIQKSIVIDTLDRTERIEVQEVEVVDELVAVAECFFAFTTEPKQAHQPWLQTAETGEVEELESHGMDELEVEAVLHF